MPSERRTRSHGLRNGLVVVALLLLAGTAVTALSTDWFRAFGGSPNAATVARMKASPYFTGRGFRNAEPTNMGISSKSGAALKDWLFGHELRVPSCPLPIATDGVERLAKPPASGLRVTWLGHSTTLIELDGATILTDPTWSERASPFQWVGPRRFHPPPIALADLPHLDAVTISHDHYDHLDMATVRALAARGVPFYVPLGIGAHLAAFGVPEAQIHEADWWEASALPGGVSLVSTPARHFTGRGVPGRIGSHWTSWSMVGPKHRVFFSGDTGLTEAFREIAQREGPFDLALVEIGQWDPSWGDIHLGPRGALDADVLLGAKVLFPIHWATFELGLHAWSEPAETLTREAEARGLAIVTPRLGEPVEPTLHPVTPAWWRALPPTAASCP